MNESMKLALETTIDPKYIPNGDNFRSWNRLQWWNWSVAELMNSSKELSFNREDKEKLMSYIAKTKMFIGTKVEYICPSTNMKIIGFIEEPRFDSGKFISNIERVQFSGQNSWLNYRIKGANMEDMKILIPLSDEELAKYNSYLSYHSIRSVA